MFTRQLACALFAVFAACLLTGCPKTVYWSHDVVPIPDNNIDDWAVSTIEVSRSFTITDLNVTVNVTHPDIADCDAWLESPEGEIVPLIFALSGADLVDTTFNDEASATIDTGTSPYTGSWLVDSFYVNAGMFMVDGEDAQGTWTLNFRDQQADNVGEITSWSLRFNSAN